MTDYDKSQLAGTNKSYKEQMVQLAVDAGVRRNIAEDEYMLRPTQDGKLGLLSSADGKTIIAEATQGEWWSLICALDKWKYHKANPERSKFRNNFINAHRI